MLSSKIPKRYKRNSIKGDLHRSKRIASNFEKEIKSIRQIFIKADYPLMFLNSVINQFKNPKKDEMDESYIIPPELFQEEKPIVMIEIPFCEENEKKSKDFIKKFHKFTNDSFRLIISWKTRKIRSLFTTKHKDFYRQNI